MVGLELRNTCDTPAHKGRLHNAGFHMIDGIPEEVRYLPAKAVVRATSLSRTTLWRLSRTGAFPAPYPLSPGRVGWSEAEVRQWLLSRGCQSSAAA